MPSTMHYGCLWLWLRASWLQIWHSRWSPAHPRDSAPSPAIMISLGFCKIADGIDLMALTRMGFSKIRYFTLHVLHLIALKDSSRGVQEFPPCQTGVAWGLCQSFCLENSRDELAWWSYVCKLILQWSIALILYKKQKFCQNTARTWQTETRARSSRDLPSPICVLNAVSLSVKSECGSNGLGLANRSRL